MSLDELRQRKAEMEAGLSVFFAQAGAAMPELEREYAAVRDELERRERAAPSASPAAKKKIG